MREMSPPLRRKLPKQAPAVSTPQSSLAAPVDIAPPNACVCGGGCPGCSAANEDAEASLENELAEPGNPLPSAVTTRLASALAVATGPAAATSNRTTTAANAPVIVSEADDTEESEAEETTDLALTALASGADEPPPRRAIPRLDHVRIHDGRRAAKIAESVSARALVVGNRILFARGQLAPGTPRGDRVLAHELSHIVHGHGRNPGIAWRLPDDAAPGDAAPDIDGRSFEQLWSDFERVRGLEPSPQAVAMMPTLIARMGPEDAVAHAGDLAIWLIHHDEHEFALRALSSLETGWWIRYATGSLPTSLIGGYGLPTGPEALVVEGEAEATAGADDTARKLLGVAHLMVQMMLDRLYAQDRADREAAASLGDAGPTVMMMGRVLREDDVARLNALRTRILNVYPGLAAEAHRSGDDDAEAALSEQAALVASDAANIYTLADMPDGSDLSRPVGPPTRPGAGASGGGRTPAAAPTATPSEASVPPSDATAASATASTPLVAPPAPDRVIEGAPPFENGTALALPANHYVSVHSERYAVSEVLSRATAWARNLFGVQSSIVVAHVDDDAVIRYYAAALNEDLTESFPAVNPLQPVSIPVGVTLESLPNNYDIMVIHVGNGAGFWPSRGRLSAYEAIVARQHRQWPAAQALDPTVVHDAVFAPIQALMTDEATNREEIARLLAQLDSTAFATISSDERLNYLRVLIEAWTFQSQERAVVEIMKSVASQTELNAIIARLRDANLWEPMINDLDYELWSLLAMVGERFGTEALSIGDVYRIMAEAGLLTVATPIPGLSIGPNGPEFGFDVIANIEEGARGFLRFVEGIWDAIVMLVTHPDKIVEGLAQLTKMVVVFKLAELGYVPAMVMRDQILQQFGRQLLNGFRGMGILGVGIEVVRRIKWSIIWEVASFFIGIGEIKAAMTAMGLSARVGAIARFIRLLGLAGRAVEAEEAVGGITRLAAILGRSSRILHTEEEVLVALSHLPEDEAARLARAIEGVELGESMTLAQLTAAHPELGSVATDSLARAEVVHQLAARAGGFSDDIARAFSRLAAGGHDTPHLARIVGHIPEGEGARFVHTLGMISNDAALAGPRGLATLEAIAQSPTRMAAVDRFGFNAVDALMERAGRSGPVTDEYLAALAAIERELPEATRAVEMQRFVEALAREDAEAIARIEQRVASARTPAANAAAASAAAHTIPAWQEEYLLDILEEAEGRGLISGDRAAAEARMRADIVGRSEDEVMAAFHEWDRQLELSEDVSRHAMPPPGEGHVDFPNQDLPVMPRESRPTAPATPGAPGARDAARVEVGPADITAYRAARPELGNSVETVAVARTDVAGMETMTLEGGSPRVLREGEMPPTAVGPVESPNGLALNRHHAEQDIANQFIARVEAAGLTDADLEGRTLAMHISNPRGVCYVCRSGLEDPNAPWGVLRQLSERYPGLTIRVTVDGPPGAEIGYKALIINSGETIFSM